MENPMISRSIYQVCSSPAWSPGGIGGGAERVSIAVGRVFSFRAFLFRRFDQTKMPARVAMAVILVVDPETDLSNAISPIPPINAAIAPERSARIPRGAPGEAAVRRKVRIDRPTPPAFRLPPLKCSWRIVNENGPSPSAESGVFSRRRSGRRMGPGGPTGLQNRVAGRKSRGWFDSIPSPPSPSADRHAVGPPDFGTRSTASSIPRTSSRKTPS